MPNILREHLQWNVIFAKFQTKSVYIYKNRPPVIFRVIPRNIWRAFLWNTFAELVLYKHLIFKTWWFKFLIISASCMGNCQQKMTWCIVVPLFPFHFSGSLVGLLDRNFANDATVLQKSNQVNALIMFRKTLCERNC